MTKKVIFLGSNEVIFNLEHADFVKMLGDEDLTDSLVQFNPMANRVTVDIRADDLYAIYAGAHECICCGKYEYLAPAGADGVDRCGLIDLMLMKYMPADYVETYRKKRIEMFETLIDKGLNPRLNSQFERALALLKKK